MPDKSKCDRVLRSKTSMSKASFHNFHSRSDGLRWEFSSRKLYALSDLETKTPLPESFACLFDPQRIFGNPLRTFGQSFASRFLQTRDFSCNGKISVHITRGPLGCLRGFWSSGPKPCGGGGGGD